jgi:hypothetical protein
MTDNKYLTKVCALLKAPPDKTKPVNKKAKHNKYSAKINKAKKVKPHQGDTIYRTHKVK